MAAANMSMYKKTALTLIRMARDLFLTDIGEKIPTINEYTETFDVSRGIVQNALGFHITLTLWQSSMVLTLRVQER